MARVHHKTAGTRKGGKTWNCGKCGRVIPKGETYLSAAPGWRGPTLVRCTEHPFRPSELTTSNMSVAYAALLSDVVLEWGDEM